MRIRPETAGTGLLVGLLVPLVVPVLWAAPAFAQEYPPLGPSPAPALTPVSRVELPRTGDDTGRLLLLGGAAVVAGGALVLAARRKA